MDTKTSRMSSSFRVVPKVHSSHVDLYQPAKTKTFGKEAYTYFINGLLEVTDNLVDGEIKTPEYVLRYDSLDHYLVVAADKGTATLSDTANSIAQERGFWLGDAFASGGSKVTTTK